MARIRTIKPDFFTSDDVCSLTPLARLLYIGLWCEADREGRMVWTPKSFKRRYLPDDECEIDALCKEIIDRKLVRLYGDGLAVIPTFSKHQHVNPREAASILAEPPPESHASPRVTVACPPVTDAQVGKEGKEREGKEGEGKRVTHASPLPEGWKPSEDDLKWAKTARPDLSAEFVAGPETERFCNHCRANNRTAFHWGPNWRNWISKAQAPKELPGAKGQTTRTASDENWPWRMTKWREDKFWPATWGPEPGKPGCFAPKELLQ